VTASAVRALRLIGTITAGAADLTTHGTGLSSIYLSFGQGSSLLWTHTLRPFIAGPLS